MGVARNRTGALPLAVAGSTVSIAPTANSANVALGQSCLQLQILNNTTAVVFIKTGDAKVVATTADYPIGSGLQVVISVDTLHSYVAAVLPTGTGTVYFTPVEGA